MLRITSISTIYLLAAMLVGGCGTNERHNDLSSADSVTTLGKSEATAPRKTLSESAVRLDDVGADTYVAEAFRSRDISVEIDAVCSFDNELICWDKLGNRNTKAEKRLRENIDLAGGESALNRFPKPLLSPANRRLVIVKTRGRLGIGASPSIGMGPSASKKLSTSPFSINVVGDPHHRFGDVIEHIQLQPREEDPANRIGFQYLLRLVDFGDVPYGTFRLDKTSRYGQGDLPIPLGSQVKIGTSSFRVESVEEGGNLKLKGFENSKTWTMILRVDGLPERSTRFMMNPVNASGSLIQQSDELGNPFGSKTFDQRKLSGSSKQVVRQVGTTSSRIGNKIHVITTVNPKQINALRIDVSNIERIDITDVSVNPAIAK